MLLDADNPKPFPTEFIDRMYADMDWPMKRGVLKLYRATSGIGDLAHEYVTAFKGSSIPTLVIWGEGDRYIPVRYADMQKDFFEAEVHTLPDVGHWPMIDAPTEVEQLVLSFLNKNAQ